MSEDGAREFRRLLVRSAFWYPVMALMLFVPAGTIWWLGGWVYLLELFVLGTALTLWLAQYNPALLRERTRPPVQQGQKGWDRIVMALFVTLYVGGLVLAGFEGGRTLIAPMPASLQVLGVVLMALFFAGCWWTFRENSFAAPVVRIQTERGHRVIDTGPYAIVRHPMYAGAVPFFFGTALVLQSWLMLLVIAPALSAILAYRSVREEETLARELPGYAAYRQRVRWRLLPYVW
jgi:protein-S-isoprenylcysteine O-methyltransferase Ste14